MKTLFTFLSVMVLSFSLQAQFLYTDFEDNQNVSFTGWPNPPVTIENPDASGINTSDSVAEFVRSGEAWAHALTELDGTINFDEGTTFTIKVWAPIVNEMLFKLESADGSSVIENFKNIETTEEWVEMSFDFPDAENDVYSKIVLFFDAGNSNDNTYYFDDLAGPGYEGGGTGGDPVDLPVTFDDEDVTYGLTDFGGNASEIVVDPTDENNMVAKTIKTDAAETWAGTTVGGTQGFETPVPFEEGATVMKVAVWSPTAGTPVRLKVEDASDGTISVETEANTTVAEAWEVLEFDFSEEAEGTAEINFDNTYNKASIFFNFGTDGATAGEQTYYWDDMVFAVEGEKYIYSNFDDNQNVSFTGWPNPPVTIENPDPSGINTSDSVAEFVRSGEAWAHALTELDGTINFDEGTTFTIKVWAPIVNEMLFKLESADGSSVIENFKNIETTEEWVEMSFDFPDAENDVYSKIVLFFDAGNSNDNTYYFDDLAGPGYESGGGGEEKPLEAGNIQKNFEDGDWSTGEEWMFQDPDMVTMPVTTGPEDDANHVGDYNRSGSFEYTNAQVELDHRMDLSERHVFEMKVYFPSSNDYSGDLTPTAAVKLQNSLLGGNAWQTQFEVKHTVETYDSWVTMQFDFNEVSDSTNYDQIVVQFGGEAHTVPGQFYFDDFMLKGGVGIDEQEIEHLSVHPNPANNYVAIEADKHYDKVEIMDISGQLVKSVNGQQKSRIDVSSLEGGVYIVNIYKEQRLVGFSKMIKR